MSNENKTVFNIFTDAIGIYIQHLPTFIKYMTFPVLGQFAGILLSFGLSLWFAYNATNVISDPSLILPITLMLTIPGLIIFVKAFWEYIVAYVAVSSMTENTAKSGRIYDIEAHKKVATKRVQDFVGLWLLFGLFTFVAIVPPMWFFGAVIFVFLVLIFQVFTFEKKLTPSECFKRSWQLVQSDFWGTLGLLVLVGFLTYWLLPKIVEIICSALQIMTLFTIIIDPLLIDTINTWNTALEALSIPFVITSLMITKMIVGSILSTLVICYTLPLRSIAWTLWYKKLSVLEIKAKSKKKKAKTDV